MQDLSFRATSIKTRIEILKKCNVYKIMGLVLDIYLGRLKDKRRLKALLPKGTV